MTGGSGGNSGRPGRRGCTVGVRVPGGRRLRSVFICVSLHCLNHHIVMINLYLELLKERGIKKPKGSLNAASSIHLY